MSTTEQDMYEARISKLRFACAALAEEMGHMREQRKDEVSRVMFLDQTAEIDSLRNGIQAHKDILKNRDDLIVELRRELKSHNEITENTEISIKSFDFPKIKELLNIPDNEVVAPQIVPKIKELMFELANAKHEIDQLKNELKKCQFDRDMERSKAVAYTKAGILGHPTTLSALTLEASKPIHGYTMQQPTQNQ